eukprot:4816339-Karenia_brevis.AAC.1
MSRASLKTMWPFRPMSSCLQIQSRRAITGMTDKGCTMKKDAQGKKIKWRIETTRTSKCLSQNGYGLE